MIKPTPAQRVLFDRKLFIKLTMLLVMSLTSLTLLVNPAQSAQVSTQFATIQFENRDTLKKFNQKIGCTYETGTCLGNNALPEASAGFLVSSLVENIKNLLDMHPGNLQFHIHVLAHPEDVKDTYRTLYGNEKDFIAFYSPKNQTIYLAASALKRSVLIHEMAHAIVDCYFDRSPPVKIHELLAQYVEGAM